MKEIFFWIVLVGAVIIVLIEAWDYRKNPRIGSLLISYLILHLMTIYLLMRG